MLARAKAPAPARPFGPAQETVKLTVLVPRELHRALRRAALDEDKSLAELVRSWASEWLASR